MACFTVGLSLCLLVSSFSFVQTESLVRNTALPLQIRRAQFRLDFGYDSRWPKSRTSPTSFAESVVNRLGLTLRSFLLESAIALRILRFCSYTLRT
jgi:hypothetical protein